MQRTTRFLFLFVIGFLAFSNRTVFGQEPIDLSSIELQVTDLDGSAILGAQVSAILWDGTWSESEIREKTDEIGKATLAGLPPNSTWRW